MQLLTLKNVSLREHSSLPVPILFNPDPRGFGLGAKERNQKEAQVRKLGFYKTSQTPILRIIPYYIWNAGINNYKEQLSENE